jgi:pimeloyl-ACP methyl ester carboxylesterase
MMEERDIQVAQVGMHTRDFPGPHQAIIFLHFGGANLMMWQRAVPYFQDRYRLVIPDLRGHGKSSQPLTDYGMDTMAGDIAGLMD